MCHLPGPLTPAPLPCTSTFHAASCAEGLPSSGIPFEGRGGEEDYAHAAPWYLEAANQKKLFLMYSQGPA